MSVPEITLPTAVGTQAIAYLLVFCRVGGLFALAPIFSGRLLPARAKLIVAAALSIALTPLAAHGQALPDAPLWLAGAIAKEIAVGLAFALVLAGVGAAVQAGASLLDSLVGFSFAQIVDPITNNQVAILGQLYTLVTVSVFVLSGGDRLMIQGLAGTYSLVPLGAWPGTGRLAALAASQLDQVVLIAVELAAPLLVTMLLVDAALALVSRAVPQMNVYFVGLPAKVLAAFAVVGASLPFAARHIQDDLANAIALALHGLGG